MVEKGVVYWDQRPFSYFCSKHKNLRLNASTVPQCEFDLFQLKPLNEPRCERTYLRGFSTRSDINQPGNNTILIFPITLETEGHALVYLYDEKQLR